MVSKLILIAAFSLFTFGCSPSDFRNDHFKIEFENGKTTVTHAIGDRITPEQIEQTIVELYTEPKMQKEMNVYRWETTIRAALLSYDQTVWSKAQNDALDYLMRLSEIFTTVPYQYFSKHDNLKDANFLLIKSDNPMSFLDHETMEILLDKVKTSLDRQHLKAQILANSRRSHNEKSGYKVSGATGSNLTLGFSVRPQSSANFANMARDWFYFLTSTYPSNGEIDSITSKNYPLDQKKGFYFTSFDSCFLRSLYSPEIEKGKPARTQVHKFKKMIMDCMADVGEAQKPKTF